MKRLAICLVLLNFALAVRAGDQPQRPRILGISHIGFYVSDLQKARRFYEDFLGFAEPYDLKHDDGSVSLAFVKINDDQTIELSTDPPKQDGQLSHIAFYTDSAEGMREYLASRGIKVPDKVPRGKIGNLNFTIKDPDGHSVEIVEYTPDSWATQQRGKYIPATRIADHMPHVGVTIAALDPSMQFYGDILGFREFWRGSSSGKVLSWVDMRVPDGEDYLEFMLYANPPDARSLGVMNHLCLVVPDMQKAVDILKARAVAAHYTLPIEIKVGKNGKRQANLFDPDGTRVELMEPNTIDGKPVPPSAAPPPR
jgi:catechol 2,3-dioxygenase-like lactoylglutathione lyase family enzyme